MTEHRDRTAARIYGRRACLLLVPLCVAALACNAPETRPPDILLISVDSLRQDHLGSYGAERDTSPTIDRLASEGARFETVLAPTSWTLPSHVTLLTGLAIPVHRVARLRDRIDPARRTLAEHLAHDGYRTAAFVSAPLLHGAFGFERGFDVYRTFGIVREAKSFPLARRVHKVASIDRPAAEVVDSTIAFLEAQPAAGPPLFLFVHLWDPHFDYSAPPPYETLFDPDYSGSLDHRFGRGSRLDASVSPRDLEHLKARYDGEVRWTDEQIRRLVAALETRETLDRTVVALVSDHGEEFFEHGGKGHMRTLFEESVRIPWILRYPQKIAPDTQVSALISLEDVAPTLLDLANAKPLPEATGLSRVPELQGHVRDARPVLLSLKDLVALRGPDWKVVSYPDGRKEFYDLNEDPREQAPADADAVAPEAVAALAERESALLDRAAALDWSQPQEARIDSQLRARLVELGYIDESREEASATP